MSANRRNGFELSKNKYHARFESLESRRCLSASMLTPAIRPSAATTPPASITTQGHTLTVKDTEAVDTITVTDDGAGDVNVAITNSTGGSVTSGSGTGITNVRITGSGGGDTVDYNLGGTVSVAAAAKPLIRPSSSATNHESISIDLSKGTNTVNFADPNGLNGSNLDLDIDVSGGGNKVYIGGGGTPVSMTPFGNLTNSTLSLDVYTGGGGNTVDESFGALTSSKLFSSLEGSGGTDTLAATLAGDLNTSQAYFSGYGGGGSNALGVTVTGEIAADSLLNAQLIGGFKGSDTIDFTYTGLLDGKLFADTTGTGGNETISQSITANDGSTGSIHSLIAAGRGSAANTLTLTLTDDSGGSGTATSTLKSVNATILDQPGDTPVQNVSANDTSDVNVITQRHHGWFFGWLGFGWGW